MLPKRVHKVLQTVGMTGDRVCYNVFLITGMGGLNLKIWGAREILGGA